MPRQSQGPALAILLTRPLPQSERFARQLRYRFGDRTRIVISPLLAPRFLTPKIPEGPFDGLIFTSETGVEAFRRLCAEAFGTAWCVGDRTARAAREAGFQAVSAGGAAEELLQAMIGQAQGRRWLHARGRDVASDLAEKLNIAGIETEQVVVYAQETIPLAPMALSVLSETGPVVAPVFSPRSGKLLAAQQAVSQRKAELWITALSDAVAAEVAPARPERISIARRPDAAAMLDALSEWIAT